MGLFGNLFGKKEAVGNDINPETGNFVNNDNNPQASAETLQNRAINLQARQAAETASQEARVAELNSQTGPVADSAAVMEAGSAAYAQAYEQTKTEATQGLAGASTINHEAAPAAETSSATSEVEINLNPAVEPILNEGAPIAEVTPTADAVVAEVAESAPDLTITSGAELDQAEAANPAEAAPTNPTV